MRRSFVVSESISSFDVEIIFLKNTFILKNVIKTEHVMLVFLILVAVFHGRC